MSRRAQLYREKRVTAGETPEEHHMVQANTIQNEALQTTTSEASVICIGSAPVLYIRTGSMLRTSKSSRDTELSFRASQFRVAVKLTHIHPEALNTRPLRAV